MNFDCTSPVFERVLLEKIEVAVGQIIDRNAIANMELKSYRDVVTQNFVHQLRLYLAGKEHKIHNNHIIKYPENWWQAVKDRFFPEWLKKKFPVKWHEDNFKYLTSYTTICPHTHVPQNDSRHIEFIIAKPPEMFWR